MTASYTRLKTVRFEPDAFRLIEIGARTEGITISEYIRDIVMDAVAEIDLEQVLSEPGTDA